MKDVVEFVSDAVSANATRAVMGAGVAAAVEEAEEELAQMAAALWTASPSRADLPQLQAARIMAASESIIGRSTTQVISSLHLRIGFVYIRLWPNLEERKQCSMLTRQTVCQIFPLRTGICM